MATSKSKKLELINLLKSDIVVQKSVLLLTTNKANEPLTANKNTLLRKQARKEGVVLKMIKINLVKNIFKDLPDITGQLILAYSEDKNVPDEVSTPKAVVQLSTNEFKENINIVGCVVNGEFYDVDKTIKLSKTLTKNESLAMTAGTIKEIIARIARVVNEVPTKVARGVSEVKNIKS